MTKVLERDLATQLPGLAAKMRRIAHHPRNWMDPPRNIYGWKERPPINVDAPDQVAAEVHRPCDGWVPRDLITRDELDELREVDQTFHPDYEPGVVWLPVANLETYLLFRYKLVESQTRVIFTYTVDAGGTLVAPIRHLSIQITVPGKLSQGALNEYADQLLGMQDGTVRTFFPATALGTGIRAGIRVGSPWEFRDPSLGTGIRAVTWKTPIVMDFVLDHDLQEPTVEQRATRKVQLYGPDGSPL